MAGLVLAILGEKKGLPPPPASGPLWPSHLDLLERELEGGAPWEEVGHLPAPPHSLQFLLEKLG